MSLFTGTADYYRQYRPGIPEEVAAVLDRAAPTAAPRRLLDIGTGTGMVVEALGGRFDDIIAVDNDTGMLHIADAVLRPALPPGSSLALVASRAEDFRPPAGWQAHLVTICRAFHWLDQATVLELLDDQVASGGAVAVFGDSSFWSAGTPWKQAVWSVVQEFLGGERRAGSSTFEHHNRPYSEVMEESPFCQVEETRVPVHRTWTTEGILGCLHSTSFAAPHLLGDRLTDFGTAVKAALSEHSSGDTFTEDNDFLIRIGRRG
ncbi:class I SAM-dependent methyltransferase [Streptomyces sp. NPDC001380]|uniref:class I SAM-dependent methyltransferase n=1 Tax=Streptomyces sp. NPDC001380 TaxID=3364566 RepID=UPI0036B3C919